jgi:hypothetical protein
MSWNLFAVVVLQNFCSSSPMVHSHQNQCCVPASDNCVDCRRSDILELRINLQLSSTARACGNAEPQIC